MMIDDIVAFTLVHPMYSVERLNVSVVKWECFVSGLPSHGWGEGGGYGNDGVGEMKHFHYQGSSYPNAHCVLL